MEENKWFQLLKKHGTKGVLGLLVVATVLIWGERLFGKKHGKNRQDYIVAAQVLQRFQQGERIELESLLNAEGIVRRHPELKASYEAMLARGFFEQNDPTKGAAYAAASLKRNETKLSAPYTAYAQTSLLIAEGKLDEALTEASRLQPPEGSILEAFNLLRIAMLSKEPDFSSLQNHPRFAEVAALFQEGDLSFEVLTGV